MKIKNKNLTRLELKFAKPRLGVAMMFALSSLAAQAESPDIQSKFSTVNSSSDDTHQQAYAWLNSQGSGSTIQFNTVYGLENCVEVASEFKVHTGQDAYCFESSSKPNRFFAISGAYPTIKEARQATSDLNIDGFIVNSINRIKNSRCEIPNISSSFASNCNSRTQVSQVAANSNGSLSHSDNHGDNKNNRVNSTNSRKQSADLPALVEAPIGYDAADQKKSDLFTPVSCTQTSGREIQQRRRPGYPVLSYEAEDCRDNRLQAPRPTLLADPAPVPDRWRIVDTLGYAERWWDPYNGNNRLKGDKPIFGKPNKEWFFNLSAISDTVLEPRNFPLPVGAASTSNAGQLDLIADGDQFLFNENLIVETVLYRGDTVFRPPDHEFCLLYTSPSPRDLSTSRMPSSA